MHAQGSAGRTAVAGIALLLAAPTAALLPPAGQKGALVAANLVLLGAFGWRLSRGRLRGQTPWWLGVAALLVLTTHDVRIWLATVRAGDQVPVGPVEIATVGVGYLLLLAAAAAIAFPAARRDLGGAADAMIIAFGGMSLVWSTTVHPALRAQELTAAAMAARLALVLVLALIVGALWWAAVSSPRARPSLVWVLVAVLLTLAGATGDMVTRGAVGGGEASWVTGLWVGAYVALAVAAVHPSAVHLARPERRPPAQLTRPRLVLLGAVVVLNPALGWVQVAVGRPAEWWMLATMTAAVVPLVGLRLSQLVDQHADAVASLAHLAGHDPLTGLPNRRSAHDRLRRSLALTAAGEQPGTVLLFLDLDDFKQVNDTHGHPVGDRLLDAVAHRLRGATRAGDVVARFGGDEFLVVCAGDPDVVARVTLGRLTAALSAPVEVDGRLLGCAASIGVAVARPGDVTTADQLLSAADAAMYAVKRAHRARTAEHRPVPSAD